MASTERSIDEVLRAALAAEPRLRLAVLFGSAATGRTHGQSDVDIAILPLDPALSLHDELALQSRLAAACGRDVDLVRLDQADVVVRREVARDGRPLFESDPGAFARFAAEATLEYLDFEPVLKEAQRRYLRRLAAGS